MLLLVAFKRVLQTMKMEWWHISITFDTFPNSYNYGYILLCWWVDKTHSKFRWATQHHICQLHFLEICDNYFSMIGMNAKGLCKSFWPEGPRNSEKDAFYRIQGVEIVIRICTSNLKFPSYQNGLKMFSPATFHDIIIFLDDVPNWALEVNSSPLKCHNCPMTTDRHQEYNMLVLWNLIGLELLLSWGPFFVLELLIVLASLGVSFNLT